VDAIAKILTARRITVSASKLALDATPRGANVSAARTSRRYPEKLFICKAIVLMMGVS
jgi:hypothetical protein